MANLVPLHILKQGVEVWNKWRKEHLDIQPNFYKVDLSEKNLLGVDLSGAYLREATLNDIERFRFK